MVRLLILQTSPLMPAAGAAGRFRRREGRVCCLTIGVIPSPVLVGVCRFGIIPLLPVFMAARLSIILETT